MDDGDAPLRAEEVEALAPDVASLRAGRQLATPAPWSECGHDERAVWGCCKGSGAQPYRVSVDTWGPAYRCSCPSRKFPCKHALGLLLRWSARDGAIPAGSPPAEIAAWLAGRVVRSSARPEAATAGGAVAGRGAAAGSDPADRVDGSAGADLPPVEATDVGENDLAGAGAAGAKRADPEAAAARAARRTGRIVAGMAELERWLEDLVRQGIGRLQGEPFGFFDAVAARLVDAQAPGAAQQVRRLDGVVRSGDGWPGRLLERLAALHMLATAWAGVDALPPAVQADLRAAAGWPELAAEVLADTSRPRESGSWYVLARSVTDEERVRAQRTWLWELGSARLGVIVDFARPGAAFSWDLWPGNVLRAELARYPGSAPLRVLVAEQHDQPAPGGPPPAWPSFAAVAAARAEVLAADPWLERWPLALAGAVADGAPGSWSLRDAEGRCVRLDASDEVAWRLVATCKGVPATVLGEWEDHAVRPLGVWSDDRMVVL
jgi:hypothetical protein